MLVSQKTAMGNINASGLHHVKTASLNIVSALFPSLTASAQLLQCHGPFLVSY